MSASPRHRCLRCPQAQVHDVRREAAENLGNGRTLPTCSIRCTSPRPLSQLTRCQRAHTRAAVPTIAHVLMSMCVCLPGPTCCSIREASQPQRLAACLWHHAVLRLPVRACADWDSWARCHHAHRWCHHDCWLAHHGVVVCEDATLLATPHEMPKNKTTNKTHQPAPSATSSDHCGLCAIKGGCEHTL